jgi:hypothetical protein
MSIANISADLFSNGAGKVLIVQNIGECIPPLRVWNTTGTDTDYVKFYPFPPSAYSAPSLGAVIAA